MFALKILLRYETELQKQNHNIDLFSRHTLQIKIIKMPHHTATAKYKSLLGYLNWLQSNDGTEERRTSALPKNE